MVEVFLILTRTKPEKEDISFSLLIRAKITCSFAISFCIVLRQYNYKSNYHFLFGRPRERGYVVRRISVNALRKEIIKQPFVYLK